MYMTGEFPKGKVEHINGKKDDDTWSNLRDLRRMTTFWLSFTDPEVASDKRFLGVAIFDMDESEGERSVSDIVKHSHALGINPGGAAVRFVIVLVVVRMSHYPRLENLTGIVIPDE
jgi:hypothetical protein